MGTQSEEVFTKSSGLRESILLTVLSDNKDQIQDVDSAITIYIGGVFGFQVNFVIKIRELASFCFNQTSTEPCLLNRLNPILIYINQLMIHYQCLNIRPNTG